MIKYLVALLPMLALPVTDVAAQSGPPGDNSQIGSRFKRKAKTLDEGDVRNLQKDIANCIAYGNKDLTRSLLQHSDAGGGIDYEAMGVEEEDLLEKLDVDECIVRKMQDSFMSMQMTFSMDVFRNLLAEEVYLMDYEGPLTIGEDEGVEIADRTYVGGKGNPRVMVMVKLADCMVHMAPVESHAFIDTKPGSKKEAKAVKALAATIDQCSGQPISASVDTGLVRRVVADGLWTRAYHQALAASKESTEESDA